MKRPTGCHLKVQNPLLPLPSCLREKCSHFHHSLRQGITLDIISPCGLMALHDTDKNATNDIEPFHQRRQQEVIAQKEKPTHTHNGLQDSFADRIRCRPLHAGRILPSNSQGPMHCTYASYEYWVPGRLWYGNISYRFLRILFIEGHYSQFCYSVAMLFCAFQSLSFPLQLSPKRFLVERTCWQTETKSCHAKICQVSLALYARYEKINISRSQIPGNSWDHPTFEISRNA